MACIASPCCTPLIVPILLTLLAGTPVAVWMGHHLGWVYGGLTLVSIISLVMALRWTSQRPTSNRATLRPLDIPVSAPKIGDKAHAE
ncbi:MAG: hypothetical protein ABI700_10415 [Chloroflexota bacterium]